MLGTCGCIARGARGVVVTDSYEHEVTLHGTLVPNIASSAHTECTIE